MIKLFWGDSQIKNTNKSCVLGMALMTFDNWLGAIFLAVPLTLDSSRPVRNYYVVCRCYRPATEKIFRKVNISPRQSRGEWETLRTISSAEGLYYSIQHILRKYFFWCCSSVLSFHHKYTTTKAMVGHVTIQAHVIQHELHYVIEQRMTWLVGRNHSKVTWAS